MFCRNFLSWNVFLSHFFSVYFGVEIELFSQYAISESKQFANQYKWLIIEGR